MPAPRNAKPADPLQSLPPESRTVGQVVGESVRLYRDHFWKALATGVLAAVVSLVGTELGGVAGLAAVALLGSVLLTAGYLVGISVANDVPLDPRSAAVPFAVGAAVFVPFPFLVALFIVPGLVWLGFFGLAAPAALVERRGFVDSLRRGVRLGRADLVHALGTLATLALLVGMTQGVVFFLLREYAEDTVRVAAVLTYALVSPLLFLGSAVLYQDQAARAELGSPRARRKREPG